jgi:hypothetical protein
MTTTAHDLEHDLAARRESFMRRVRRTACALARTRRYFTADDIAEHVGRAPEGVDGRIVGNALHGLRVLGLIEPVTYARTGRSHLHGRAQALWKTLDPGGCGRWLDRNPPGPEDPPTTIQLNLPF